MCMPENVKIGLWVDDPKRIVLDVAYFDKLEALGISSIAVMIDTSNKPWDPRWSLEDINRLCGYAVDRNIDVTLTTWPYPNMDVLEAMVRDMLLLLSVDGVVAWEVDTEHNWKHRHVNGFDSLHKAGYYLFDVMRDAAYSCSSIIGLTTFAHHVENGRFSSVAKGMDFLMPQAYSIRKRRKRLIPWNHSYGPGRMQKYTLDRTILIPNVGEFGGVALGCGLAAYGQKWPGRSTKQAMRKAFDVAVSYGCREIRYWSSKWVIGVRANGYAARFLESLRDDIGGGLLSNSEDDEDFIIV